MCVAIPKNGRKSNCKPLWLCCVSYCYPFPEQSTSCKNYVVIIFFICLKIIFIAFSLCIKCYNSVLNTEDEAVCLKGQASKDPILLR